MTEAFVYTETDRTKSKWVAESYRRFVRETGRSRTTLRGLFYSALGSGLSDYPICGGFVGEIRITRPYHESDGEKLSKWAKKTESLGFIPQGSLLEESHIKEVLLPERPREGPPFLEVWVNRSAFNPLLHPICSKHGVVLVSLPNGPDERAIEALLERCPEEATIFCLSDLDPVGAFFASEIEDALSGQGSSERGCEINAECLAITPQQVGDWTLPQLQIPSEVDWGTGVFMVKESDETKAAKNRFKALVKPFGLDPRKRAELDSLEAHHPGGVAGLLDQRITEFFKKG